MIDPYYRLRFEKTKNIIVGEGEVGVGDRVYKVDEEGVEENLIPPYVRDLARKILSLRGV